MAQALALLNHVVGGDYHRVLPVAANAEAQQNIRMAAFKRRAGWAFAAVSSDAKPRSVRLNLPRADVPPPKFAWALVAADPFAHNEDQQQVRIERVEIGSVAGGLTFKIPAYGLIVLPLGADSTRIPLIDSGAVETVNAG